ncbi:uncharacterized protein LOC131642328 [Vicia villosa]|uniref:uncharacterized protein LOC131642328 n=1 Tax=Vicia villosa TaxID=3911 RepID=UPI00273AF252|nr:uncharacterized protein LOC131642328 [Vicia villosa]
MLARFWWGSKNGERKVHWLSWDKLSKAKNSGGLGFHGISDFNKSLLGKQYWRLMECESSLVGRVFKGRYFPRSSVDKSCSGFSPSYAWRSILSAREIVHKGSRWRIGDGNQIKVYEDRWLPSSTGFKVQSHRRMLPEDNRVADLIDEDLKIWKRDIIFQAFDHEEAVQIVSIPLTRGPLRDKMIWHFEKSGEYTVRSAYHLSLQVKDSLMPGPSSPPCKKLWQQIWKIPVHTRVKNFLWRTARNILPTKHNLLKKGISLDPTCSLCNKDVESVQHLFLECDFAKAVCFSSILSYRIPSHLEFNDWLLSFLTCGDVFSAQVLCSLVYRIWLARNSKLYQAKVSLPVSVAAEAVISIGEFNNWNVANRRENLDSIAPVQSNKEVHFIHVDASFSVPGTLTMGCIIKDLHHNISLSACKRENVSVDVAVGEAMAIRWGLDLATALRLERIVIKSDAKVAVDCVNDIQKCAALDPVVVDIKSMLSSFSSSSLLFHSRNCNFQAHNLAKLVYVVGFKTWIGVYPSLEDPHGVPAAVS